MPLEKLMISNFSLPVNQCLKYSFSSRLLMHLCRHLSPRPCRNFLLTPQDSSAARSVTRHIDLHHQHLWRKWEPDSWWQWCLYYRAPVRMSSQSSKNFKTVSLSAAPMETNPDVGSLWVFAPVGADVWPTKRCRFLGNSCNCRVFSFKQTTGLA